MWHMIQTDVLARYRPGRGKLRLIIVTDGHDTQSPAQYNGRRGMHPMMRTLHAEGYDVECVLERRKVNGIEEYLVKWVGWESEHNEWKTSTELNCDEVITAFLQGLKQAQDDSREMRASLRAEGKAVQEMPSGPARDEAARKLAERQRAYEANQP